MAYDNNKGIDPELEELSMRGFASKKDYDKASEENKLLVGGILKSKEDGSVSWICGDKDCGALIVKNINGDRVMLTVNNGIKVFVKFFEMAAYCPACGMLNDIMLSGHLDNLMYEDDLAKENNMPPSSKNFFTEHKRAKLNKVENKTEEMEKYLLGLK
jgi:hypothetical protein